MNKQEVNRTIDKKYVGTLKADSKVRVGWKGESTKIYVATHRLSIAMCAQIASYYRLGVQQIQMIYIQLSVLSMQSLSILAQMMECSN